MLRKVSVAKAELRDRSSCIHHPAEPKLSGCHWTGRRGQQDVLARVALAQTLGSEGLGNGLDVVRACRFHQAA